MDYSIDTTSYPKARRFAVGHGYLMRASEPTSGVIHTTNNARLNTAFSGEAAYLFESADVSAHFLIGKQGQIVQFLDPAGYSAWHAGSALSAWTNDHSVGIELHVSVGEVPTAVQKDATAWLCRQLMQQFGIAPALIETHRKIALPAHRKSDPEGWPDADFYAWRASLDAPAKLRRFRVRGVPIYQAQNLTGTLAGHLNAPDVVEIDATYSNGGGHLASGLGFIDLNLDALEEI